MLRHGGEFLDGRAVVEGTLPVRPGGDQGVVDVARHDDLQHPVLEADPAGIAGSVAPLVVVPGHEAGEFLRISQEISQEREPGEGVVFEVGPFGPPQRFPRPQQIQRHGSLPEIVERPRRDLGERMPDIVGEACHEKTRQRGNDQDVTVRVRVVSLKVPKDVEDRPRSPDLLHEPKNFPVLVRLPENMPVDVLPHERCGVPADRAVFQEGDFPILFPADRTGKFPKAILRQDGALRKENLPGKGVNGELKNKIRQRNSSGRHAM